MWDLHQPHHLDVIRLEEPGSTCKPNSQLTGLVHQGPVLPLWPAFTLGKTQNVQSEMSLGGGRKGAQLTSSAASCCSQPSPAVVCRVLKGDSPWGLGRFTTKPGGMEAAAAQSRRPARGAPPAPSDRAWGCCARSAGLTFECVHEGRRHGCNPGPPRYCDVLDHTDDGGASVACMPATTSVRWAHSRLHDLTTSDACSCSAAVPSMYSKDRRAHLCGRHRWRVVWIVFWWWRGRAGVTPPPSPARLLHGGPRHPKGRRCLRLM